MPQAADIYYAGDFAHPDRLPVILIHGAGGSHFDWPREIRHLPNVDVLAIDLPGHGRAPGPGRESIEAYAETVIDFLDTLSISRAAFVGHSMGGAIALMLALGAPDRVTGLGLISTGAKLRVSQSLLAEIQTNPEAARRIMGQIPATQPKLSTTQGLSPIVPAADPETTYHDFLACDQFDVLDRLGEIQKPTCVIVGGQDPMTPVRYGTFLAEQIAGAVLTVISGSGHMVTLEHPVSVAAALSRWLGLIPSMWV